MRVQELPGATDGDHELRFIRESDLEALFAYLSSPLVTSQAGEAPASVAELDHCVWRDERATDSSPLRLAIASKARGTLVGTVGLHSVSVRHRSAEIAFDLSPQSWGQGIATHMTALVVSWAHRDLGLVRVQATALPQNSRSLGVLERCGFEREGLLRNYRMVGGQPRDFVVFSHVDSGHAC